MLRIKVPARYAKFTYKTPYNIWWPRAISTTRRVKLIENSYDAPLAVKPQVPSILSRETRRFVVFRGTAIRPRRPSRECVTFPEVPTHSRVLSTGTLVTSRKRKVTHIILELAFLREICRVSRSEPSLTVVTSAVVEYLGTGRILDESVCHLLAHRGFYCVSLQNRGRSLVKSKWISRASKSRITNRNPR